MDDEHELGFMFDMPQDRNHLSWRYDCTASLLMQGWTPMHCAADTLHPKVMEILLHSCTPEALNAADVKVLIMTLVPWHTTYG